MTSSSSLASSSSSSSAVTSFTVKFQRQTLAVQLPPHATVLQLKEHLHSLLDIPPERQKLLLKATLADSTTLAEAGIQAGSKVLLLAASPAEVAAVEAAQARPTAPAPRVSAAQESQRQRQRQAALQPQRIHQLEVLELPEKDFALRLLEKLRDDLGIREILEKHNWHIGLLKELSPLEQKIAGYNRNRGEEITVKLRNLWDQTWRSWPDIMETMLHELAHCDHAEHDANFHRLNRQLNKEVKELDWTKGRGSKVGGDLEAYNPAPQFVEDSLADTDTLDWREATKHSSGRQLGGESQGLAVAHGLTPAQMAGLMAEIRLSRREQEQVDSCGSGKPPPPDAPTEAAPVPPTAGHGRSNAQPVGAPPETWAAASGASTPVPGAVREAAAPFVGPADGDAASDSRAGRVAARPPAAADPPPLPAPACPVCGEAFPSGASERYVSNHVEACLARPLPPPADRAMEVDGAGAADSAPPAGAPPPGPAPACPLCGVGFPADASERFMSNHVEQCLASAG